MTARVLLGTESVSYSIIRSESIMDIVHDGEFVYGVGRYANGDGFEDFRTALIKVDAFTGDQIWARLGHVPENSSARLYGNALVVEGNAIISGSQYSAGSQTGTVTNAWREHLLSVWL